MAIRTSVTTARPPAMCDLSYPGPLTNQATPATAGGAKNATGSATAHRATSRARRPIRLPAQPSRHPTTTKTTSGSTTTDSAARSVDPNPPGTGPSRLASTSRTVGHTTVSAHAAVAGTISSSERETLPRAPMAPDCTEIPPAALAALVRAHVAEQEIARVQGSGCVLDRAVDTPLRAYPVLQPGIDAGLRHVDHLAGRRTQDPAHRAGRRVTDGERDAGTQPGVLQRGQVGGADHQPAVEDLQLDLRYPAGAAQVHGQDGRAAVARHLQLHDVGEAVGRVERVGDVQRPVQPPRLPQPERQVLTAGVHALDLVALPVGRAVPLVQRHVEAEVVVLHVDVLVSGIRAGPVVLDPLERAQPVPARLRAPAQRPAGGRRRYAAPGGGHPRGGRRRRTGRRRRARRRAGGGRARDGHAAGYHDRGPRFGRRCSTRTCSTSTRPTTPGCASWWARRSPPGGWPRCDRPSSGWPTG